MSKIVKGLLVTALVLGLAPAAFAFDFADFAKNKLLVCVHPTVKADSAKTEMVGEPKKVGDVTTAKVKVYYHGAIKKNEMTAEISVREAGGTTSVKAEVLADTTTLKSPKRCDYTVGWQDVK
jgi:hypothetical protein